MDSVRLLLALAATRDWSVHHLDVKSAFLNGELTEVVHVRQPPGFIVAGEEGKVLRLRKALYGLRQAPQAWNIKLDTTLATLGFKKCSSEHAMYTRRSKEGILIVGVYVDDLIVTGSEQQEIKKFKSEMAAKFKMSDLGLLTYYLGIEPAITKRKIVALSTCEAEYISGAAAACHGIWPRRLREDITGQAKAAPILGIDNKSAIELAKNPVFHSRSKHIDIKFHFIRDCVERKQVVLEQVGTEQQLADVFTKPLGKNNFEKLKSQVGMVEIKQEHSH
ncbi:hypothetical protein U9M48_020456 [Paspalum notatum var. saurae]|uniref:Reverse transcriptase Ty1/copia-type domain-containing protein n=1 Tax=Paspalum notatum var. saurae TaxID=547442 RepID=A0AAQ3TEQ7_PASNO